jgi:rRNA-processing protein FCF1
MNSADPWSSFNRRAGLLIDTNLLVLLIVGGVNLDRIENFKRTRQYSKTDYQLLVRVLDDFTPLYTLAHVMAEVSNLTDLSGTERLQARQMLKETVALLREPELASIRAAEGASYESLGLVDAAISALAREQKCAVLTDDLDLYLSLSREGIVVLNFTHLRERVWNV